MASNYISSSSDYSSEEEIEFRESQSLILAGNNLGADILHQSLKSQSRAGEILKIVLNHNSLTFLPDSLRGFSNLVCLRVSHNLLSALPSFLSLDLPHLVDLQLSNNLITETDFPKDVTRFARTLKSLDLSGNRLTGIPGQIFSITGLQDLRLGGNRIESVQPEVRNLKNLKFFYLGGNRLKRLPKEICHLEKLKALILCDNQLESLPDCICKLKNLRYLQLYSNKLTTLPNGLIFLNSLVELSLRDNPLVVKFVKQIDVQVPSLLELAARAVKIHRIPYGDRDLPSSLVKYLISGQQCVNPKCCGVYFESRVEHVKFVDFCGKYRIPLMQYLCSVNCRNDRPAVTVDTATTDQTDKMKRVLLG